MANRHATRAGESTGVVATCTREVFMPTPPDACAAHVADDRQSQRWCPKRLLSLTAQDAPAAQRHRQSLGERLTGALLTGVLTLLGLLLGLLIGVALLWVIAVIVIG